VLREDHFKCPVCTKAFNVKDNELIRPSLLAQNILDNGIHLSDEEKALKISIADSIDKLHQLYNEYEKFKVNLDLECHEHFVEIRRQMDIHREHLMAKFDKIYIEMVEKTKTFEAVSETK
jgi:hypothetical protein